MGRISILLGSPKIKKTAWLIENILGYQKASIFSSDKTVERFRFFYDKNFKRPKGTKIRGKRFDLSQIQITNEVHDLVRQPPRVLVITDFPHFSTWSDLIFDNFKKLSFISEVLSSDIFVEVTVTDDSKTHEMGARLTGMLEQQKIPFSYNFILNLSSTGAMIKLNSSEIYDGSLGLLNSETQKLPELNLM